MVLGSYKSLILTVSIALFIIVSYFVFSFLFFLYTPASSERTEYVIEIRQGQTFRSVTSELYKEGLISDERNFLILGRLRGAATRIRAGELSFNSRMTPLAVLDNLIHGRPVTYSFTIPEGFNLYQIGELLENNGIIKDSSDFIASAKDEDFARSLGVKAETMEGYLFPDTYVVERVRDVRNLINIMYRRYLQIMEPEFIKRAHEIGFTEHELVIFASIIEKETGFAPEREIVSSVFHNRLKKGMRLQSDPTTIYGLWETFDGNLTRNCLRTYTPYNTYRIFGLPKGPIASPGRDSIVAALYPADTEYLFFVSRNDGTHVFSKNYADHNKAVDKYQRNPEARRGRSWRDVHRRQQQQQ